MCVSFSLTPFIKTADSSTNSINELSQIIAVSLLLDLCDSKYWKCIAFI